jgi:hypothetical protein
VVRKQISNGADRLSKKLVSKTLQMSAAHCFCAFARARQIGCLGYAQNGQKI